MPCPSATFTVWASAWLVGAAAPDDVLDALAPWADAHDVQAGDGAAAAATALPPPGAPVSSLPFLMAALRRAAPRCPARLVLPAPGDVRGLPGPGLFSREATAAGDLGRRTDAFEGCSALVERRGLGFADQRDRQVAEGGDGSA